MGHIINKKKRGRPPKSDLSSRTRDLETESDSRVRRSLRRRNVRYNFIDYDDFIDDGFFEEEEEDRDEEEESRREKKVKLVMKLNQASRDELVSGSEDEEEEEDEDEGSERRVVKKRRISGCEEDEELENGEARRLIRGNLKKFEPLPLPETSIGAPTQVPLPDKKKLELILDKLQKKDTYGVYAEPVDPEELPDYHDVIEHPMDFSTVRKKLANGSYSILDQIEVSFHSGFISKTALFMNNEARIVFLRNLKSDIFLICSNAMRYNSPETIYHKQARIIQELGQKKFHKLRIDYECSEQELKLEHNSRFDIRVDFDGPEKEPKSDQRAKSSLIVKKQMKKSVPRYLQEPIGSDFSAGAVLAGDLESNVYSSNQVGNLERHVTNEGVLESSSAVAGNNLDKAEELSIERSLQPKLWRKPSTVDENLRATYIISNQPTVKEESTFTTFDGESRQLIAVGLHAEYSYARSLSRFAATLGPIAWRNASQMIEEAVPSGCKFGRGWVDEYEPPPTPVLLLEHTISRDSSQLGFGTRKNEGAIKTTAAASNSTKEKLVNSCSKCEMKPSLLRADTVPYSVASPGLKPSNTAAVHSSSNRTETPILRSFGGSGNRVVKQFELNSLPSLNQCNADYVAEKKPLSDKVNTAAVAVVGPRFGEIVSGKEVSEAEVAASRFRGPSGGLNNKTRFESLRSRGDVVGTGLTNGKIASSNSSSEYNNWVRSPSSSSGVPNEMLARPPPPPASFFLRQDQGGLSDPVQLMRMLAGKAAQQQEENSSNNVVDDAHPSPMMMRMDDSRDAATVAASAVWMSIGGSGGAVATTAENTSRPRRSQTQPSTDSSSSFHRAHSEQPHLQQQQQQQLQPPQQGEGGEIGRFQHGGSPYPSYVQVAASGGRNEVQQQQLSNRHMVFPQFLSRLQPQMMMPSWRGISPHSQQQQPQPPLPRAKQESRLPPPDLNIGFQSPVGSPVTPQSSTGVIKMMDSQQPDLALQL